VVEALRIFYHYHFRVPQKLTKKAKKKHVICKPPRKAGESTWFEDFFTKQRKIRERELFA